MSRLYVKTGVDKKWNTKARRAHKELTMQALWGSRGDSKVACEVTVHWEKEWARPMVTVNGKQVSVKEV